MAVWRLPQNVRKVGNSWQPKCISVCKGERREQDTTSGGTLGVISFASGGTSASEKRGACISSSLTASAATTVAADLIFYTNGSSGFTPKMRIAPDGNVGIGSSSPGARLEVSGEIRIVSSAAYNTHLNYLNSGTNFISMANSGATYFRNKIGRAHV